MLSVANAVCCSTLSCSAAEPDFAACDVQPPSANSAMPAAANVKRMYLNLFISVLLVIRFNCSVVYLNVRLN